MQKILAIARKEIYLTFNDRNLLVIMLASPLLLSLIMGLAFGGIGGSDSFSNIPVAIVNLDEGAGEGAQASNYGQRLVDIFIPTAQIDGVSAQSASACTLIAMDDTAKVGTSASLGDLVKATVVADEATARAGVDDGTYVAAIIIPEAFSANLSPELSAASFVPSSDSQLIKPTAVEVYASNAQPVSATIIRSIVTGITNQFATGSIAIAATVDTLAKTPALLPSLISAQDEQFRNFSCGFIPGLNTVKIERVPINKTQTLSQFAQILVRLGSAQAIFFSLFTGIFGVLSIYDERKEWTLQRLLVSPTPRPYIIGGKIVGSLATIFLQMGLLMLGMMAMVSILERQITFIWGTELVPLLLVLLALVLCVSGFGVIVVGLAKTREQAQLFGPILNMGLGILGGSFGFTLPVIIAQISLIYWAADAFSQLANGNTDVALHIIVLLVQGVVMFVVGSYLFNRRVQV